MAAKVKAPRKKKPKRPFVHPTTKYEGEPVKWETRKAIGRPSSYTEEKATSICNKVAAGEYLCNILQEDGMPSHESVRRWQNSNPDFRGRLARARIESGEWAAAEAAKLLDEATPANIMVTRERASHLRWRASTSNPGQYGPRAAVDITMDVNVKLIEAAPAWLGQALEATGPVLDMITDDSVIDDADPSVQGEEMG